VHRSTFKSLLEQLDVEGFLAFAEHLLSNTARLWLEAIWSGSIASNQFSSRWPQLPGRPMWNRENLMGLRTAADTAGRI
jgi:hypothetical protein